MKEKNKEELIKNIGFQFDEAMELFGEETLEVFSMMNIIGGDATQTYCGTAQCGQCISGCQNYCSNCAVGCGGTSEGTPRNPGGGTGSGNHGYFGRNCGATQGTC